MKQNKSVKIESVMTQMPHSVGLDQPLSVAKTLMREHGIRHLPVQSGGKLVGVLSDRDVKFAETVDKSLDVEEILTPEPYLVSPETPLDEVTAYMAKERIGCALVVSNEKLIGIYTTVDACRDLTRILRGDLTAQ